MLGVFVRPALPVSERHDAKEAMGGIERVRLGDRDRLDPCDGAIQVAGELRGSRTVDSWIELRIGLPAVRPAEGRPQAEPFDDPSTAERDATIARSNQKNHVG